jgi:hypothetical protein
MRAMATCVYTVLVGGYERLNEQPIAAESALPFICLSDNPGLTSETWQVRQIEPTFAMDPIRSQRDLKTRPHLHLPSFSRSLYIDNSIVLKVRPEVLFETWLTDCPFALPPHSFRETVLDEFLAVAQLGFDDPTRIFEQLNHYALSEPEVLNQKPWWSAILLRDHEDPQVRAMSELWAAHIFRYSRRDQLSINLAFQRSGLAPKAMEIDNHESPFHSWPHTEGRERLKGARDVTRSLTPVIAANREAEHKLAELERTLGDERLRIARLEAELSAANHEKERAQDRLAEETARAESLSQSLAETHAALAAEKAETTAARAKLVAAQAETDAAHMREAELWDRYAILRKRSILRLPRSWMRED